MYRPLLNVSPEPSEWSLRPPWVAGVIIPISKMEAGIPELTCSGPWLAIAGDGLHTKALRFAACPHKHGHSGLSHDPILTVGPGLWVDLRLLLAVRLSSCVVGGRGVSPTHPGRTPPRSMAPTPIAAEGPRTAGSPTLAGFTCLDVPADTGVTSLTVGGPSTSAFAYRVHSALHGASAGRAPRAHPSSREARRERADVGIRCARGSNVGCPCLRPGPARPPPAPSLPGW